MEDEHLFSLLTFTLSPPHAEVLTTPPNSQHVYVKSLVISTFILHSYVYIYFSTLSHTQNYDFPAQLSAVNHYRWLIFLLGLHFYALLTNSTLNSPAPLKISPIYSLTSIINFILLINFIQNFLICSNLDFFSL